MNRRRLALFLTLGLAVVAVSASGQGWPLPAKTPNTPILCNTAACLGKEGKKLVGYPDVFKTFTGRFLDSVASRDYQYSFRTARARMLRIAPERNRVYAIFGSALVAYDLGTFFKRVESREELWPSTEVPVSPRNSRAGAPEAFLKWDAFFYAESGGGWLTEGGDGQERLFGFDWDDRGNVYLAYGAYSWGVVKDDGKNDGDRMSSLYQHTPAQASSTDDLDAARVFTLKSGKDQFVVICGKYSRVNIFNVNNPARPFKHRDMTIGPVVDFAKSADGQRIAVIKGTGAFAIYSTESFLANGSPMVSFDQWNGSYGSVTTDGTNFFAGVRTVDAKMGIYAYTPTKAGYTETRHEFAIPLVAGVSLRYGAGYLTASAGEAIYSAMNLRLFRLSGHEPKEVSLSGYYAKHYSTAAAVHAGIEYTNTPYSVLLDSIVHNSGGKSYLVISNFGLGDIYELAPALDPNIAAPTRVAATTFSTTRVDVSWDVASGATSYTVERMAAGGQYTTVGSPTVNWFSDTTAIAGKAYLYRVSATVGSGLSPFSAPDLATTFVFTDPTLPIGTLIKAVHVTQLHSAIAQTRLLAGLPPFNFTGGVAAGQPVLSIHFTQLQTALGEAEGALGLAGATFSDANTGNVVRASHLHQLRERVQ